MSRISSISEFFMFLGGSKEVGIPLRSWLYLKIFIFGFLLYWLFRLARILRLNKEIVNVTDRSSVAILAQEVWLQDFILLPTYNPSPKVLLAFYAKRSSFYAWLQKRRP